MPDRKYCSYHHDEEDPLFMNLKEIYNKTATESEDWQGLLHVYGEWLKYQEFVDFKSAAARDAEAAFLPGLCQDFQDNDPPLFTALNEEGILSAVTLITRRFAANVRRRDEKASESEETLHEMSVSPAIELRGLPTASANTISLLTNIKAEYNGNFALVLLQDIDAAANPALNGEELISRMTLQTFLSVFCEDFDLDASTVEVRYTSEAQQEGSLVSKDRHVRAFLKDACIGEHRNPVFRITSKGHGLRKGSASSLSDTFRLEDTTQGSHFNTVNQTPQNAKRAWSANDGSGHGLPRTATPGRPLKKTRTGTNTERPSPSAKEDVTGGKDSNLVKKNNGKLGMPKTSGGFTDSGSARGIPLGRSRESSTLFTNDDQMQVDKQWQAESPSKDQGSNANDKIQDPKDDAAAHGSHEPSQKTPKSDDLASKLIVDLTGGDANAVDDPPRNIERRIEQPSNTLIGPEVDREMVERLETQLKNGFENARNEYEEKTKKRNKSLKRTGKDCDEDKTAEEDENDNDLAETVSHTWPSTVTEHLDHDDNGWEDCCRFFRLDPEKAKDPANPIKLPYINVNVFPYQLYGAWTLLEMETFQKGGYLADGMGLGKTLQCLIVIGANRARVKNQRAVNKDREAKDYRLHLKEGTTEHPQPADAVCPSQASWVIQCACVDSGITKKIVPCYGPNLIFAPPNLVAHWLKEANKYLKPASWKIMFAYSESKYEAYGSKLDKEDYKWLKPNDKPPYFNEKSYAEKVIVVTTSGSYPGQVQGKFKSLHTSATKQRGRSNRPAPWVYWPIGWGRIIVDEVHNEHNASSGTISRIREINGGMPGDPPRKILISGTPFETTPEHMAGWISVIEDETWEEPPPARPDYPRMNNCRRDLVHCTKTALQKLGREHSTLVKAQLTKRGRDDEAHKKHAENMAVVVKRLWIRRTGDSNFMGYDLVKLPANYHFDCLLEYPHRYKTLLEAAMNSVCVSVRKTYHAQVEKYRSKQRIKAPGIATHTWLQEARRARILSSFPELGLIDETKDLSLTVEELKANGWITVKHGALHELEEMNSPYEKHIEKIAGYHECTKFLALAVLMDKIWEPRDQVVIMGMGPVSALIIYWAIRKIMRRSVVLVHAGLRKVKVAEIVDIFQKGQDESTSSSGEEIPQFIVGSTRLLNVGFTLTAAKHVVIFDSEWLLRDELQAICRVSRIGQREQTATIKFVNVRSGIDMAIHDRQGARRMMYNTVEAPLLLSSTEEIRVAIEEDGLNDDDDDETNGHVHDNHV